jgi:hypothetical protein
MVLLHVGSKQQPRRMNRGIPAGWPESAWRVESQEYEVGPGSPMEELWAKK